VRICFVVGTRPQVIKSALIINALRHRLGGDFALVHTGQHYDYEMFDIFVKELLEEPPEACLGIRAIGHGEQTGQMLIALERYLKAEKPELVAVPGDTNSALAAALAAVKLQIPVAHIEAGARCFDPYMPEEINRIVIDHVAAHLYAPTPTCVKNLRQEGLSERTIHTGDPLLDILLYVLKRVGQQPRRDHLLVTVHRQENVDDPQRLTTIVRILQDAASLHPVIFPIHPRTVDRLRRYGLWEKLRQTPNLELCKPVGYEDFIRLLATAYAVLTDSGGVQREAFHLGTPCITLRDRTEWPETVEAGANVLVGLHYEKATQALHELHPLPQPTLPTPFGDGQASQRIVELLIQATE